FSSRRRHTRSKRDWSSDVCSSDLDAIIFSTLFATTAVSTPIIPITEISGNIPTALSTFVPSRYWTIIPSAIGTSTIWIIEKNIAENDTGSQALASSSVNAGVTIGARRVVTDVAVTDKAMFPFARKVITLLDVPPGEQTTRITPIAISGGS